MRHCKNPKPTNQALYNRIKAQVKSRVKRWPSAYASGQLVRSYKQKGGGYRCNGFGSLDRWFKEKWVDVCKSSSSGKNVSCGRKKSSPNGYPYCRPSVRVSKETPRTYGQLSKSEIKKRCALKHRLKGKRMSFGRNLSFGGGLFSTLREPRTLRERRNLNPITIDPVVIDFYNSIEAEQRRRNRIMWREQQRFERNEAIAREINRLKLEEQRTKCKKYYKCPRKPRN